MKRMYKYPVKIESNQEIDMPVGFEILTVEAQYDNVVIYAIVDDDVSECVPVKIKVIGTGHPIPDVAKWKYLNTVLPRESIYVWHVFIEI